MASLVSPLSLPIDIISSRFLFFFSHFEIKTKFVLLRPSLSPQLLACASAPPCRDPRARVIPTLVLSFTHSDQSPRQPLRCTCRWSVMSLTSILPGPAVNCPLSSHLTSCCCSKTGLPFLYPTSCSFSVPFVGSSYLSNCLHLSLYIYFLYVKDISMKLF